jgi:hypothetical protein
MDATGAAIAGEAPLRLLDTHAEQYRWLLANREAINAKIRHGIKQLDRGEGIPEVPLGACPRIPQLCRNKSNRIGG